MIKRNISNILEQELDRPEINILLGARQAGKTTFNEKRVQYGPLSFAGIGLWKVRLAEE